MMDTLLLALLAVMPGLVIAAALSDLTTMRIPNWLSGLMILGFFPAALAVGLPLGLVGMHVLVALAALLLGMALFAARVFGGGDAKLIAAACLWMGPAGVVEFVLLMGVFGGMLALGLMTARRTLPSASRGAPAWVGALLAPKGDIPYGVAIAAGALVAFPYSGLVAHFVAG